MLDDSLSMTSWQVSLLIEMLFGFDILLLCRILQGIHTQSVASTDSMSLLVIIAFPSFWHSLALLTHRLKRSSLVFTFSFFNLSTVWIKANTNRVNT